MSTAPTTVFDATHAGKVVQVLMSPAGGGLQARYTVICDGAPNETIVATRAWRAEQKQAIARARELLGLPQEEPKPAAEPVVRGPTPISGVRRAKMAALWAQNARESGATGTPEELLRLGREHADTWADLGREAFNNEMSRLEVEANDLCEGWEMAAREKVLVY